MSIAAETENRLPWENHYPADVDYRAILPVKPLGQLLEDAAARFADRPAFDFLGKHYTYAELHELTHRAARGFQKLGVTKGTRVGLILPNCPYYPIAYFGVLQAGGTVVNFNPLYTERELTNQIVDSKTSVLVTIDVKMISDKVAHVAEKLEIEKVVLCRMQDVLPFPKNNLYPLLKAKEIGHLCANPRFISFATLTADSTRLFPVEIDPQTDIALLQYTGGTTGIPKGAMLTHANVYANTVQSSLWFNDIEPGRERVLGVIPFFHVFAMTTVMNFAIYNGAEIIALPRFDIRQTLAAIDKKRPTLFPAVPTIYTAINNHAERNRYDLSSIKFCISGGAPLPIEVKEQFERLTGCRLVEGYGLSETSPVACCNPIHGVNKTGSIGVPLPQTVIEIVSLEDHETLLPPGEKGELTITGPQVMAGYWNQPEETSHAMAGGRFHTGDVGYMDEDGYTFIVDRLKDMIIAGGFKIYPRTIEEAAYQHPAVEECVAAGVADDYRGQTVKLWVKRREGQVLTDSMLKDFLKDHISTIEMPKAFEIRDEALPKTLIGKLSRKALLEEEAKKLT